METIRGHKSFALDVNELNNRLANYNRVFLDLGTGDGRYVRYLADTHPAWFIIGVDSCRENLRQYSRAKLSNMLFLIANAQELPDELKGWISHISINFPWGSLLGSLLNNDPSLICSLHQSISRSAVCFDLRLNSGALTEAGTSLETGAGTIRENLLRAGWQVNMPVTMDPCSLKCFPSTWAKRLAFGRDPRAVMLTGYLK